MNHIKNVSKKKAVSAGTAAIVVVAIIVVAAIGVYLTMVHSQNGGTTPSSQSSGTSFQSSTVTQTASQTSTTTTGLPATLPPETISETGSTLLYPLFNLWVPNFTSMYPSVKINTAGTGSGTGISSAETGTVQIGASDAYMSNSQIAQYPSILNIPLAISAQGVFYNIPGIPNTMHLNLSGPVLAGIYNGSITYWDSPQISELNPAAASLLPHQLIIPIHRSDGSGDTFIFTQYLSFSTPSWNKSIGFGTTVSWPSIPNAQAALGNGGMVQAAQQNRYSIAYIGVSYLNNAEQAGLGYAYLENRAGNFVNFSPENIQAAANAMVPNTPKDERISLIFAPGADSYPIINYEYAIVSKNQPNADVALVIRTFLTWAVLSQYGNSPYFLNQVHFIPLPQSVVQLSEEQIAEIGAQ
jgi:phosphate transport system substrate-binding protein